MSETAPEQDAPTVGKSELDLLVEIRDLLTQLVEASSAKQRIASEANVTPEA